MNHADGGFWGVGEGFPPGGTYVSGERRGADLWDPDPWERLFAKILH